MQRRAQVHIDTPDVKKHGGHEFFVLELLHRQSAKSPWNKPTFNSRNNKNVNGGSL